MVDFTQCSFKTPIDSLKVISNAHCIDHKQIARNVEKLCVIDAKILDHQKSKPDQF